MIFVTPYSNFLLLNAKNPTVFCILSIINLAMSLGNIQILICIRIKQNLVLDPPIQIGINTIIDKNYLNLKAEKARLNINR